MTIPYVKGTPIRVREAGYDEKWLQSIIEADPSILGLGDLAIIERERKQASGGRIDFLMYDPEDLTRYEIEVMLGKLDESHIIRTIEYWDIERRRFPSLEHRAVIVAEEITNRFFNVISLLNRSVPIIAIQLNASNVNGNLVLTFVKVLDIAEPADAEEQGTQQIVDRRYWEGRANVKSLQVMDAVIDGLKEKVPETRSAYNKNHIAVGAGGTNFLWFHPRKSSHIHFDLKPNPDDQAALIARLEEAGIECRARNNGQISSILTLKEFQDNRQTVLDVLERCEQFARP